MVERDWIEALPLSELPESALTRVQLGVEDVLLYRVGERIFGIEARCTHAGMPLDAAPVSDGDDPMLTCPAHGSRFRLQDGGVTRPPATEPLGAFEARVVDDVVQVRPRTDPRRGPSTGSRGST